ncbi:MAG: alcohol dehydrogenase catalytic domain-containing protein [Burkholderiaceae bacterium]|nr:alcohol dehydrogenase catalytic domain-containing protein [Burkholderiaceae bacterium]
MKALVYTAPNRIALREEPDPVAADGEVVLRIDAVGICGSDMHAYHGHDPRRNPPLIMGHELAGTIVGGPEAGRRVTANPLVHCGTCDYCVQGRNNLCSNRSMIGMNRPGAYAELMAIPQRCLVAIPQDMPVRAAALTEPAATALHAMLLAQRALQRPLPEVCSLVLGGGAIGLLAALLLRSYGSRVTLAETNPLRRASAERHAGCATFDPRERQAEKNGFGLVIDAVGSKTTRSQALAAVRPGGAVLHIGLQDWASEIDMRKLTLDEITLIGTYTYTTADMRATVDALYRGAFGDLDWVEERALGDGAQAFADLDGGRTASAKIVLRPG